MTLFFCIVWIWLFRCDRIRCCCCFFICVQLYILGIIPAIHLNELSRCLHLMKNSQQINGNKRNLNAIRKGGTITQQKESKLLQLKRCFCSNSLIQTFFYHLCTGISIKIDEKNTDFWHAIKGVETRDTAKQKSLRLISVNWIKKETFAWFVYVVIKWSSYEKKFVNN